MQLRYERTLALDRASLRVHQHLARAIDPVQLPLEGALDAELADERGTGIRRAIDALEILLADRAHIAERVHREIAVGVPACLAGLDIHAAELETMHGEARDLLIREAQPDRYRIEGAARVDGASDLIDVLGTNQLELREARERLIDVGHLFRHELELVRRLAARDQLTVTIEDQPTRRRDRLGAHAVALGEIGVIVVARDLQQEEARDERQGGKAHDRRADERTLIEEPLLAPMVLDAHRGHGSVSGRERRMPGAHA